MKTNGDLAFFAKRLMLYIGGITNSFSEVDFPNYMFEHEISPQIRSWHIDVPELQENAKYRFHEFHGAFTVIGGFFTVKSRIFTVRNLNSTTTHF